MVGFDGSLLCGKLSNEVKLWWPINLCFLYARTGIHINYEKLFLPFLYFYSFLILPHWLKGQKQSTEMFILPRIILLLRNSYDLKISYILPRILFLHLGNEVIKQLSNRLRIYWFQLSSSSQNCWYIFWHRIIL